MPTTTATRQPTEAQKRADHIRKLELADKQIEVASVKQQHAAADHTREKQRHAMDKEAMAMQIKAEREQRAHEKDMALMDPEIKAGLRQDRLEGMGLDQISNITGKHAAHLDKVRKRSSDLLDKVGAAAKVDAQPTQPKEEGKGRLSKPKNPFIKVDDKGRAEEPDPNRRTQEVISLMGQQGITPAGRDGRLNRLSVKKNSQRQQRNESLEEAIKITNHPLSGDMWFNGTFAPLGHHVKAISANFKAYQSVPGLNPKLHIGITGKQNPDPFSFPRISAQESRADYLNRTFDRFAGEWAKSNTPIEYKMRVARSVIAANPDFQQLNPQLHWISNVLGTPADPTSDQGPVPGSIIHNDEIVRDLGDTPRKDFSRSTLGMWQYEPHGTYLQSPNIMKDENGEKIGTTPHRAALIRAHYDGNIDGAALRQQHADMLGVHPNHPAIDDSMEMFNWLANEWHRVKQDAEDRHARSKKALKEALLAEERRHAAGVGERLLRAQSLTSVGRRIGAKPSPPTNESILLRRAKRAARYDLRRKLAPNYRNLSTGQKQDVDERIAKHAEFKKLVDSHYKEYRKKYTQLSHASSHNKKPKDK